MKNIQLSIQNISFIGNVVLLTVACVFLAGCKGSDDPSPKDVTTQKLTATTWRVSTVSVDGTDQTSLFTNMTLKFTASNYTTTKGGVVWPASGTWTFIDATAKKFKRDNDLEVTIVEVTDTTLKLSLTWTAGTFGSGRVASVGGVHTFTMIK